MSKLKFSQGSDPHVNNLIIRNKPSCWSNGAFRVADLVHLGLDIRQDGSSFQHKSWQYAFFLSLFERVCIVSSALMGIPVQHRRMYIALLLLPAVAAGPSGLIEYTRKYRQAQQYRRASGGG